MKDLNLRAIFTLLCLCTSPFIQAQNPSDCIGAIPICQEIFQEENAYIGIGDVENEVNASNSCFGNSSLTSQVEVNSVWYTFTIQESGDFCMSISPNDSSDDYDYAIFNITDASCSEIYDDASLEVSCNFSGSTACGGLTGPTGGDAFTCPAQEPCFSVFAGEVYVVLITNYSGSENGYSIDITASTATLGGVEPELESVSGSPDIVINPSCGENTILLNFSEDLICATLDAASITVSNENTIMEVLEVGSKNCDEGGLYDKQFSLLLDTPLELGNYFLNISIEDEFPITDACGNALEGTETSNFQFEFSVGYPSFSGDVGAQNACLGEVVSLTVFGDGLGTNYLWSVDANFNEVIGEGISISLDTNSDDFSAGANSVFILEQKADDCQTDTYVVIINLWAPPVSAFNYEVDSLTGTVEFFNLSTDTNPQAGNISYNWNFGDPFLTGSSFENTSFAYSSSGTYLVSLEASYGDDCNSTITSQEIVVPPFDGEVISGLSDTHFSSNMFYPNPARDVLFLNLKEQTDLQVFSINGQQVHQAAYQAGQSTLAIHDWKAGIYFLQLQTSDGVYREKLVIE